MDYIHRLENDTVYLIREAYNRFRNIGMLWSMGKDSTALLWMCRKAFFGKIPFPVIHIDTGFKFKEIYAFRDHYAKAWNLNLAIIQNEKALARGIHPSRGRLECCTTLKTETLKIAIEKYGWDALLLAIRRDEHGIRAKERYFSPRDTDMCWDYLNQPPELWDLYQSSPTDEKHFRIHPILHWREIDVWQYTKQEKIPIVPLYLAISGRRYRSIGCRTCCSPVGSHAGSVTKIIKELKTTRIAERSGRAQDKEDAFAMQKLRSLGYM